MPRTVHSRQLTFDDARRESGRGGWRRRGGRKRTGTGHAARPTFSPRHPQHVTLRVRAGLPSLRRGRYVRVVWRALAVTRKEFFRVVQFNVLANHLHLVVEADGAEALARGVQGLAVSLARRLNRELGRRGTFFAERYHSRSLRTPTEVRHVLRYVLNNQRKHSDTPLSAAWFDPHSSAAWFDGWTRPLRGHERWERELLAAPSPAARATTWLLTTGWRRCGLIALDEIPGDS